MPGRRNLNWEDTFVNDDTAVGSQSIVKLMPLLSSDEIRGHTITRMIAEISLYSTSIAGAYGAVLADLAIGVGSEESVNAGIIPDPDVADDEPMTGWLWRTRCVVAQNGTGMDPVKRCLFDVRSQRKMDGARAYLAINVTANLGTSFTVRMDGIVRTLLRLP